MIGHEEREMGFRSVLRERYPQCRLLEVLQSIERGERAGDLVFRSLKANQGIRGIYNASAGAQAVVDAIRALGRAGKVVFITHELTEARRQLLREGMIDAIIDQDPELEARTAVELLAGHFGRLESRAPSTVTPVQIHMIENS
jgi:LacI family transcriptional regulator